MGRTGEKKNILGEITQTQKDTLWDVIRRWQGYYGQELLAVQVIALGESLPLLFC